MQTAVAYDVTQTVDWSALAELDDVADEYMNWLNDRRSSYMGPMQRKSIARSKTLSSLWEWKMLIYPYHFLIRSIGLDHDGDPDDYGPWLWTCPVGHERDFSRKTDVIKLLFLHRLRRYLELDGKTDQADKTEISVEYFDQQWTIEKVGDLDENVLELVDELLEAGSIGEEEATSLRKGLR